MKKNDLVKCNGTVYRVLALSENDVLMIDCFKQKMPKWYQLDGLGKCDNCSEEELLQSLKVELSDMDSLNCDARKTAYMRYTIIAGILPFLDDDRMRNITIAKIAENENICKQTVRNYLCSYLVFQSVAALVPMERSTYNKKLTDDKENDNKNFRWAINKFYYTRHKNSLKTAYTQMLSQKYCEDGKLKENYPTFNQFRYFFSKYKKEQTVYISRDGIKDYQRNHRPLLGEVQDFAPNVGIGMIDATICDIYLVDESGCLVGRPILTIMVDSYSSGFIYGYSLTWEGGIFSLKNLMQQVVSDKVEWCKKFGIFINKEDWDTDMMPGTIVSDMGMEYQSSNFSQITELGVTVINNAPLRPDLKGLVERSFQLIQETVKPSLLDFGFVDENFGKRLAPDYRKNACLTLREYEKVIIYSILYNNNKRILENHPYTEDMLSKEIKPYPSSIFEYGKKQDGVNLIPITEKQLALTFLPRVRTHFSRRGLMVFGLRYRCEMGSFTEEYLSNADAVVAYNPDCADVVYLLRDGNYIEFQLIESRFSGKSFEEVQMMVDKQKEIVKKAEHNNLQGRIDLDAKIDAIVKNSSVDTINMSKIRETKEREKRKNHKDFIKEAAVNE